MSILTTDLVLKYSIPAGPGNATSSTGDGSLGGFVSTTPITSAQLGNLFDDVSVGENAGLESVYRCVFLHNQNAQGLALISPVLWISSQVVGGASLAVAVDQIGATPLASVAAQAAAIVSQATPPSGTSGFASPSTKDAGLLLPTIPAGSVAAIWVRRTAANSAAQSGDGGTLTIEGQTT